MPFEIRNLGLIDYNEAWDIQKTIVKQIQNKESKDTLIICQHPTVITIGKNGSSDNLLKSDEFLKKNKIEVIYNNRGGDVTLHNPGQLVAYPIFDLNNYKLDLHWFLRELEEIVIKTSDEFGIKTGRYEGYTGVWIEDKRKICAMGLHCSRWVTSHGLALNVNNDISEFNYIVPCGIKEKNVSSISKEIGTNVDFNQVIDVLIDKFRGSFSAI